MANEQNLKPFKKGEVANPNGRPKKYVTLLREQGYKLSEINDTIQVMLQMDLDELKSVWDNPKATVLEKTLANAMRKSLEKGSLYSVEERDSVRISRENAPKDFVFIFEKEVNGERIGG